MEKDNSVICQALDKAVEKALRETNETFGSTPSEIFWAAVVAASIGFGLVNTNAAGSQAAMIGYFAMATGVFVALVLRRKI